MSNYIKGLILSEPDESVLALSGDGITPEENLAKVETKKISESSGIFQSLIDDAKKIKKKPVAKQIEELEQKTDLGSKKQLANLKLGEANRKKGIAKALSVHPDATKYAKVDLDKAVEEWDYFADTQYGQCMAVDGTISEINPTKDLQSQVDSLSRQTGKQFINPRSQDALDSAKTRRLLNGSNASEFSSFYAQSANKKTIKKVTSQELDNTLSTGSIETVTSVVDVLGKHYVRNKRRNAGSSFLSSYKKNPLKRFNNAEYKAMDDLMKSLDPDWGGTILDSVTKYKRSNYKNLSADAVKLLGYGDPVHKLLMKVSELTKFDRKMNKKIRDAKRGTY